MQLPARTVLAFILILLPLRRGGLSHHERSTRMTRLFRSGRPERGEQEDCQDKAQDPIAYHPQPPRIVRLDSCPKTARKVRRVGSINS